jgi:excisionase family DNA binding protein
MVIIAGKEVLNVAECALLLNRSESRIRHMVSERLIPYYKVGSRTMFRKSEVEAHILQSQNRVPTMGEIKSKAAIR